MNDLFIQPLEFEKVSYKRVSENPAEWTGNIMEAFYSEFPFFANSQVSVNLTQKDEQKGYAIGAIKIEEGTGLVVPIIIQNRELYPFDVCIHMGKTLPLTNTTLNLYVQSRSAFQRVVKPDAGDPTTALFNNSFSQVITPTFVTDQFKTASAKEDMVVNSLKYDLLQEQAATHRKQRMLSGSLTGMATAASVGASPAMGSSVGKTVAVTIPTQTRLLEDAVLQRMQKEALLGGQMRADQLFNECLEKVKTGSKSGQYLALQFRRWALEQGFTIGHWEIPGFDKLAEKSSISYTVRSPYSMIDKIASTITEEMKSKFFDELTKDARLAEGFKQNGTQEIILKLASLAPGSVDFNAVLHNALERDIQYIYKDAGVYKMVLSNSKVNDPMELVISDEAAQSLEHIKTPAVAPIVKTAAHAKPIFVVNTGTETLAILQNGDYVAVPGQEHIKEATAQLLDLTALFPLQIQPQIVKTAIWANYCMTPPFSVLRVWKDNGLERIETFDGLEKKSYCRMQGIEQMHTENGITYLPAGTTMIKLGNRLDLPLTNLPDPRHTNLVRCIDHDAYVLEGEDIKIASAGENLHTAQWHVLQSGGTTEDLEKIAALKVGETYRIEHPMLKPIPFQKLAEKVAAEYNVQVRRIRNIARDFTKEASLLPDVPTVDAVLSLNFVNRDNIVEFAKSLPLFEDLSETLADMLLKTRLGVRIVDENVIRRTMLGIVDIIEVLAGISNLANKK